MTVVTSRARLLNNDHELIAEGMCQLDETAGQASLEVDRTTGAIQKQHGNLSLELDSGRFTSRLGQANRSYDHSARQEANPGESTPDLPAPPRRPYGGDQGSRSEQCHSALDGRKCSRAGQ